MLPVDESRGVLHIGDHVVLLVLLEVGVHVGYGGKDTLFADWHVFIVDLGRGGLYLALTDSVA